MVVVTGVGPLEIAVVVAAGLMLAVCPSLIAGIRGHRGRARGTRTSPRAGNQHVGRRPRTDVAAHAVRGASVPDYDVVPIKVDDRRSAAAR